MKNIILIKLGIILVTLCGFYQTSSNSDFSSKDFSISISNFSPLSNSIVPGDTLSDKADNLLLTIIELLMVSIGVISLLVVSIGAGYIIFYNGKEEFLTKGRSMVYTGLIALIIALSSFYIINLIRYILYN